MQNFLSPRGRTAAPGVISSRARTSDRGDAEERVAEANTSRNAGDARARLQTREPGRDTNRANEAPLVMDSLTRNTAPASRSDNAARLHV
eukprot:8635407-Alexandrium_andersonii.AAC.1